MSHDSRAPRLLKTADSATNQPGWQRSFAHGIVLNLCAASLIVSCDDGRRRSSNGSQREWLPLPALAIVL